MDMDIAQMAAQAEADAADPMLLTEDQKNRIEDEQNRLNNSNRLSMDEESKQMRL